MCYLAIGSQLVIQTTEGLFRHRFPKRLKVNEDLSNLMGLFWRRKKKERQKRSGREERKTYGNYISNCSREIVEYRPLPEIFLQYPAFHFFCLYFLCLSVLIF